MFCYPEEYSLVHPQHTNSRKYKNIENVLEFGAGSGEMAYNFLKKCNSKDLPTNYFIIEKNANLIKKQ